MTAVGRFRFVTTLTQIGVSLAVISMLAVVAVGVVGVNEKLTMREYLSISLAIGAMMEMGHTA